MTEPLTALLLTDGRPGHFNLSEGILAAGQRLRPLGVTRLQVRRGRWPGDVLAAWSNTGRAQARLVRTVYGIDPATLPPAGLVVSAGAETLAANVACARLLGAANVFYGSLRRFSAGSFALALTSYADDCRHPSQAFALKPSPAAIAAWAERKARPPASDTIAVLVGGPSGEARFEDGDWQRLIDLVEALGRSGRRCLVANSRRTPPEVSDRLAALARRSSSPIATFLDARAADAPNLTAMLAGARSALVTDDSSSMVSEAIAAGLAVVGLQPADCGHNAREQGYRDTLVRHGWYRALPLRAPVQEILATLATCTPPGEDPADPIARLLAARLPHLFPSAAVAAAPTAGGA